MAKGIRHLREPESEDYIMERLEKKVDSLCESMMNVKADVATVLERTTQLQARFEGFANSREATCPMKSALTRIGDKADDSIKHMNGLTGECSSSTTKVDNIVNQWRSFKWTWIGIAGAIGLIGSVLGILAAVGVL